MDLPKKAEVGNPTEIQNPLSRLRWAIDPVAFGDYCLSLLTPQSRAYAGLDPWQVDFLAAEHPRVLINASRQAGKSSLLAVKCLHTALYEPGSLVLVLAPALRQSIESFGKILTLYRLL